MMDRILNNKWSIRIVALVLAAILFTSVSTDNKNSGGSFQTTSQNDTEVIQNIPVEVYYDKKNLYVSGLPETVTVTISGPRSIVQNTRAQQDFEVYADLRNASIGEQEVKLKIKNVSARLKATISPEKVRVNVQEKVTKKFSVEAELANSAIADGYKAGTPTVSPGRVSITGAKDTISQIAYVKANVDESKKHKDDFETEAQVAAFDKNLNKLDVEISPQKVKVSVPVSKVGKSVPIKLRASGNPSDDITISSMTADQSEVVVVGDDDVLDRINQITIQVPVSGITADTVREIKIPVPNGANSVQPTTIEVRIKTTKKSSANSSSGSTNGSSNGDSSNNTNQNNNQAEENENQETTSSKVFANKEITLSSLPDDLTATMTSPANGRVTVTLRGPKNLLDGLTQADISAFVDLSKATAGSYSNKIEIGNLPAGVSYTLSVGTASFTIEQKSGSTEE
ncbi:hypothetical protein MFLO_07622 [Listeria floridensis FSL S10-1187]|uniref:Uncharacterized protein n=1 Tax=Listeria floridensis FSL S10-1187 TaxID=1265817 RepID=A0ABP3AYB3_9LIST|nr:CdaR family protein [Listeria floridensis]EUJ32038.1 hypothetical protein MFLO_07622 [Listeria floridensis FSL S10-1187]